MTNDTFTITKGSNVTYEINDIAAICHSVNKAYCEAYGDFSQPDWDDAPDWQRESARAGVLLGVNSHRNALGGLSIGNGRRLG
jgi:hypothetical protein